MDEIEIPRKKGVYIIGIIIFSLLSIAAGMVLLIVTVSRSGNDLKAFMLSVFILNVILLGRIMRTMYNRPPGLIINDTGITDHSNSAAAGLIPWEDIIDMRTEWIHQTKFLLVFVKNPDHYIHQATGWRKKMLALNHKNYGTPIGISFSTLEGEYGKLESLIFSEFVVHRQDRI